jgi:hypothetical protein
VDPRRRAKIAARLRAEAANTRVCRPELVHRIVRCARTPTVLMAWRLACGYTQRQLAEEIQHEAEVRGAPCAPSPSVQQLSRWENGSEKVGVFYQPLFAAGYGVPPDRLGFTGAARGTLLTRVVEGKGVMWTAGTSSGSPLPRLWSCH